MRVCDDDDWVFAVDKMVDAFVLREQQQQQRMADIKANAKAPAAKKRSRVQSNWATPAAASGVKPAKPRAHASDVGNA